MVKFNPASDIPSLAGKVVLVTGGNTGLGKQQIMYLAHHSPRKIYLAARTASKAEAALKDIRSQVPAADVEHLSLDLTSFASIKSAAEQFLAKEQRLDILVNNAGVMAVPYSTTTEGYEIQFGTNHMGHALLTKLLMPVLLKTAEQPGSDVRIVNLSSMGHMFYPRPEGILTDAKTLEKRTTVVRYGNSKMANILFTKELAARYPSITSVAIHPGVIITDLYSTLQLNFFVRWFLVLYKALSPILPGHFKDAKGGALNQTWAATTAKEGLESGAFYQPVGKKGGDAATARDEGLRKRLWEFTEAEFERLGY